MLTAGRAALAGHPGVIEYALDFGDGTRHYEGRFAASGDDEFLMIVREITERKRQQQELEASRQRIVAAGDDARRKLERNLHDGAQQRLVSVSLSLRLAQSKLEQNPTAAQEVLGGVDIVVHNAGGARPHQGSSAIPDEEWQDAGRPLATPVFMAVYPSAAQARALFAASSGVRPPTPR